MWRSQLGPRWLFTLLSLSLSFATACERDGAVPARKAIVAENAPRVAQILLDDLARHRTGLQRAADRIAPGFVKVSGERQEREMRQVLKLIRSPKKGIQELVISPMSFLAVVGRDGVAIARNAEPDKMKGMKLGEMFPVVQDALQGKAGTSLGEFENPNEEGDSSVTVLMAAPARYGGEVVGAMVLGIPLWRLSQRFSKQLQMEAAGGERLVLWVYVYRGERLFHHNTPPDLDALVPDAAARAAGLQKSPGGFTGSIQQYGFWYGYGVRPLRVLGDDVGVVVFRMDPQ